MIVHALKIVGLIWLMGWLLTWAWDIKGEISHPEDYPVVSPTG